MDGWMMEGGGAVFEMEIKRGGGTHLGVFQTFVERGEEVGFRGPQSEVCVCCWGRLEDGVKGFRGEQTDREQSKGYLFIY